MTHCCISSSLRAKSGVDDFYDEACELLRVREYCIGISSYMDSESFLVARSFKPHLLVKSLG